MLPACRSQTGQAKSRCSGDAIRVDSSAVAEGGEGWTVVLQAGAPVSKLLASDDGQAKQAADRLQAAEEAQCSTVHSASSTHQRAESINRTLLHPVRAQHRACTTQRE